MTDKTDDKIDEYYKASPGVINDSLPPDRSGPLPQENRAPLEIGPGALLKRMFVLWRSGIGHIWIIFALSSMVAMTTSAMDHLPTGSMEEWSLKLGLMLVYSAVSSILHCAASAGAVVVLNVVGTQEEPPRSQIATLLGGFRLLPRVWPMMMLFAVVVLLVVLPIVVMYGIGEDLVEEVTLWLFTGLIGLFSLGATAYFWSRWSLAIPLIVLGGKTISDAKRISVALARGRYNKLAPFYGAVLLLTFVIPVVLDLVEPFEQDGGFNILFLLAEMGWRVVGGLIIASVAVCADMTVYRTLVGHGLKGENEGA